MDCARVLKDKLVQKWNPQGKISVPDPMAWINHVSTPPGLKIAEHRLFENSRCMTETLLKIPSRCISNSGSDGLYDFGSGCIDIT
jgi:hypothetical protein